MADVVRDKQVALKFSAEEVAAWDAWAEAHKLTRTQFIETACRALIASKETAPRAAAAESRQVQTSVSAEVPQVELYTRKLDPYPSAPTDRKERKVWMDRRNAALQGVPVSGDDGAVEAGRERQRKLNESRG